MVEKVSDVSLHIPDPSPPPADPPLAEAACHLQQLGVLPAEPFQFQDRPGDDVLRCKSVPGGSNLQALE